MTFKEISTWIFLALFGWLGVQYAWPMIEARSFEAGGHEDIIGFVIAFVALFTAAHIIVAVIMPKKADESADERDKRIELYGERAGSYALSAAALFGLAAAMIADDRLYANIFFLGLVFSEIAKAAWRLFLYRRGA